MRAEAGLVNWGALWSGASAPAPPFRRHTANPNVPHFVVATVFARRTLSVTRRRARGRIQANCLGGWTLFHEEASARERRVANVGEQISSLEPEQIGPMVSPSRVLLCGND